MKKTIILLLFTIITLAACSETPKGELTLSDPSTLDTFSEENARLIGSIDGDKLVFFSQGSNEIFTYNTKEDERTPIDKHIDSYFVDPNTGRIFYSKMSEDDYTKQKVISLADITGDKEKLGELEESFFIANGEFGNTGAYYKGMYVFVLDQGYGEPIKVDVLPVDGEYDKDLYETLKQGLEDNSFDSVVSDGERLILGSNKELKISDFTSGEEEVLEDYNDVENFSNINLNLVFDSNVLYTLFQSDLEAEEFKATTYLLSSEEEKKFNYIWGHRVAYLDDNHAIAKVGPFMYLVSIEKGIKREILNANMEYDFSISGDKIYYQLGNGEIHYIDISYE